MSGEVVDIDDHRPIWSNWWAACVACGHTWLATCRVDMDKGFLECPSCSKKKGIRTSPAEDAEEVE